MKRFFLSSLVVALFMIAGFLTLGGGRALAAPAYDPAHLIDDQIFTDYNSMSTSQIQSFLTSMGSGLASYSEVENCGSSAGAHYSYYAQYYSCGQSASAAKIIHDAANAYQISPKAIMATIQKEQSLITDPNPTQSTINCAMGYYSCGGGFNSFFLQVDNGTWQLKTDIELMSGNNWWGYTPASYPCASAGYIGPSGVYNSSGQQVSMRVYSTGLYPNRQVTFDDPTVYNSSGQIVGGLSPAVPQTITLANASTAALYCYTPYVGPYSSTGYSGSYNFVVSFEAWFGSTLFPQPIGAALYRQSSTGAIYLAFTSPDGTTTTRYYVPSWDMLQNYGLDSYPTIPAADATINGMVNGGTLTSLIRDGSGNVYLVDNRVKYYLAGSSICAAWGFDCFNSNVTHTLGADFENSFLASGSNLGLLLHYGGGYYLMQNGQKMPFANAASLSASGYSPSQAFPASPINATQPLGKLILTTPGLIRFSPKTSIYYFDGSNYYGVNSMDAYYAWNLGSLNSLSVPTSSYNYSDNPTTAGALSLWYTDGTNKYVVDNGRKYKLSASQLNYWPGATYSTAPAGLASRLSDVSLGSFLKSGVNYYQFSASTKDYIPTLDDYSRLGGYSGNTTRLSSTLLANAIPNGPFALANGRVIRVSGSSNIYVVYNKQLLLVPNMDILRGYSLAGPITYPSSALSGSYALSGNLNFTKTSDGSVYFPYGGRLLWLSPHNASFFGTQSGSFQMIDQNVLKTARPVAMTDFLRNSDNGAIYYASGQAIHYVTSMSAFYRYGGRSTPVTSVNTAIINSFVLAQPI